MKYFYVSDKGQIREHNEDSVNIIKNLNNEVAIALADGMGGHKAGEVASNLAIKHVEETFLNMEKLGDKKSAIKYLNDLAEKINQSIFNYADENPDAKGLGTTFVIALVTRDYILCGNIGDSSGMVLKNNVLHKITNDHTLVNLLLKSGEITEEEASNHPRKNIVMNALGANDPVTIDIFDIDTDIDGILLCSDGLTDLVTIPQIEKVLNNDESISEQLDRLVRKANNRGGNDNISIAYLTLESGDIND